MEAIIAANSRASLSAIFTLEWVQRDIGWFQYEGPETTEQFQIVFFTAFQAEKRPSPLFPLAIIRLENLACLSR